MLTSFFSESSGRDAKTFVITKRGAAGPLALQDSSLPSCPALGRRKLFLGGWSQTQKESREECHDFSPYLIPCTGCILYKGCLTCGRGGASEGGNLAWTPLSKLVKGCNGLCPAWCGVASTLHSTHRSVPSCLETTSPVSPMLQVDSLLLSYWGSPNPPEGCFFCDPDA